MKGKAQSVLGELREDELGFVLPHEHFEVNIEKAFKKSPLVKQNLENCEFSLNNLGWIRQFPYSHVPNMHVAGEEVRNALFDEMKQYKRFGGCTLVENTTTGFRIPGRSKFLQECSKETGVHIIAGTGFYVTSSQNDASLCLSTENMASVMHKDIKEGCEDYPSVKCGIIGEIGCSWPLTEFEIRSIRASAEIEMALGCPVMIHPGRSKNAPEEIVRIYSEGGGSPSRVVMAHLDRTFHTVEDVLEFAAMGTFLEYDLFGTETSFYQQNEEVDMPSDAQRIDKIKHLIQNGYVDKILISQDIHTKHRMERFGGHGFSHIITTVIPMMMKRGISCENIKKMTCSNPANWLAFKK